MEWSKYNYIYKSPKHGTLLFNLLSGAFIDISEPETESMLLEIRKNPGNFDFSERQDLYDTLLSAGILCDSDQENRDMMNFNMLSYRFHPKVRSLTIMPTLDCNLACKYCFEEANRKTGKMKPAVIKKLKEFIKEQYENPMEYIDLEWFGGEPLLGFDIIEDITTFIKAEGIPFDAGIITNGVLLDDKKIEKLADLHINHLQITLDGPKAIHDTKRIFRNGKGSYDIILENLEKLYQYISSNDKIYVDIRINIDRENRKYYHLLYNEFKQKFPKFSVYPGIITQYQTCSSTLPCFANAKEEAEFYIEQYEQYGIVHPEFNITAKGLKSCMAECLYTNLIGPEGEMYQCLQDVGNKEMQVGSIFTGKTNLRLLSAYCSGNLTFNSDECRTCRVQTFCGGNCVNKRYRNLKFGEQHHYCAVYKNMDMLERYLDLHYEILKQNGYAQ